MVTESKAVFVGFENGEDYRQAEWLSHQPGIEGVWRYDHTAQKWHNWNGKRWAPDQTQKVNYRVAMVTARAVAAGKAPGEVKRLANLVPQKRALESLSTIPGYGTNGDDWDSDPALLGVKNGVVDLRTNTLDENPEPTCLVTKTTGVEFVPISDPSEFRERAPRFMAAMDEWTSDDPEMVGFLLLWFGSSMFGLSPEHRFLMMTGIGRNGKGALKHAILAAVGEYGAQLDANIYMRSKMGSARTNEARADLLSLKGKRITFFSEPEGNRFNEELLKAHTGGDKIVARALYSNNIQTWDPTHSITFLVNDAPEVEDLGPSMGSRVMVADFRERFDGEREDKTLYDTLSKEAAGVLAILCWAASAWYKAWSSTGQGITMPERVQEQSRVFMERNDPLVAFIDAECITGTGIEGRGGELYDAFRSWWYREGGEGDPMSNVKFASMLEKKGFRKRSTNRGAMYTGIKPMSAVELADATAEDDDDDD